MAGFDWNAHPIEGEKEQKKFDWNAHPVEEKPVQDESLGKQLARSTINAIPTAGAVAGGVIGSAGGPLGAVGGAGLGYATASELKDLANQYLLGDEPTANIVDQPVDVARRLGENIAGGAAQEMGGQIVGAGVRAAAQSPPGKYVVGKIGKAASKIASTFSGVPQREIEIYAKNADEINRLSKLADNDAQEMADQLRKRLRQGISQTKKAVNKNIESALSSGAKGSRSPIKPVLDALDDHIKTLDPVLNSSEIKEIRALKGTIKGQAKVSGKAVGASDSLDAIGMHRLKRYLQDLGSRSYIKNGKMFQVGNETSRAAANAARIARKETELLAPQIAEANGTLSRLHNIEKTMNSNLLKEGKTGASLYAAGSGGNPANAKMLRELGNEIGIDALGDAEKIATARTFGKPSLLPVDTTGKSFTRMGVSGVSGYMLGGIPGAIIAEGASSPAGLKAAMNVGRGVGNAASQTAKSAPAIIGAILKSVYNPNGEKIKGKKKWQRDGLKNILESDSPYVYKDKNIFKNLTKSRRGKEILMKASSLKPNSKAMKNLHNEIKKLDDSGGE